MTYSLPQHVRSMEKFSIASKKRLTAERIAAAGERITTAAACLAIGALLAVLASHASGILRFIETLAAQ